MVYEIGLFVPHYLMKYFVIFLIGIISLSIPLYPHESSACSCIIESSDEALENSVAVFSGKVTKITEDQPTWPIISSAEPVTVEFQVDRVWKGPSEKTIKVTTASDEGTCGYGFEMGKTYLVYSYEIEDNDPLVLKVSLCSKTSPIADEPPPKPGPVTIVGHGNILSPIKQVAQGIEPAAVICKDRLVLIIKHNGSPACVKLETAVKLEERGWGGMSPPCCKPTYASSIHSFEECVAAGNPVMESYPRQCRTPDGKHFVETIPDKEQCEDIDGLWGIWSNRSPATASCNPSTSDGGMECTDSSQCQSFCQAKEGAQIGIEDTGMCYEYEFAICMQEVRNGVVDAEWCQ